MDDVVAIAKGLTKAQRFLVYGAASGRVLRYSENYWRVLPGLHKKDLATSSITPSYLTPLGLAVRAYLQENRHDT